MVCSIPWGGPSFSYISFSRGGYTPLPEAPPWAKKQGALYIKMLEEAVQLAKIGHDEPKKKPAGKLNKWKKAKDAIVRNPNWARPASNNIGTFNPSAVKDMVAKLKGGGYVDWVPDYWNTLGDVREGQPARRELQRRRHRYRLTSRRSNYVG